MDRDRGAKERWSLSLLPRDRCRSATRAAHYSVPACHPNKQFLNKRHSTFTVTANPLENTVAIANKKERL